MCLGRPWAEGGAQARGITSLLDWVLKLHASTFNMEMVSKYTFMGAGLQLGRFSSMEGWISLWFDRVPSRFLQFHPVSLQTLPSGLADLLSETEFHHGMSFRGLSLARLGCPAPGTKDDEQEQTRYKSPSTSDSLNYLTLKSCE